MMEATSFEHSTFVPALSPTQLLEFNRTFQQLYAYRLQEIMFEQQQKLWTAAAAITPPSSPSSSTEDRSVINPSVDRSSVTHKRLPRTKIRFNPYHLQSRPKHLSAIQQPLDAVEVHLSYHENMVRTYYPSKEHQSLKEIRQKEQKAFACRVTRAKTRVLQTLLKTQHEEAANQNRTKKLRVAQQRVYANALYQLLGLPQCDFTAEWENVKEQFETAKPEGET